MTDFLPEMLPDVPVLTYIEGRGFRTHKTISTAKAAFTQYAGRDGKFRPGAIYRVVGSRWVPLLVIRPGTTRDDYTLWTAPKTWAKAPGITTVLQENPYN